MDWAFAPPQDPLAHMLKIFDETCMAYAALDPKPTTAPKGFKVFDSYDLETNYQEVSGHYLHRSSGLLVKLSQKRCELTYRGVFDLPKIEELTEFREQVRKRANLLSETLKYEELSFFSFPLFDGYLAGGTAEQKRWGLTVVKTFPLNWLQLSLQYER